MNERCKLYSMFVVHFELKQRFLVIGLSVYIILVLYYYWEQAVTHYSRHHLTASVTIYDYAQLRVNQ